jgi:hypothetical protein
VDPPSQPIKFRKPRKAPDQEKYSMLKRNLEVWRRVKAFSTNRGFGPLAYMSDAILNRILDLSRHAKGSPSNLEEFAACIEWSNSTKYGHELLPLIHSAYPSRLQVKALAIANRKPRKATIPNISTHSNDVSGIQASPSVNVGPSTGATNGGTPGTRSCKSCGSSDHIGM